MAFIDKELTCRDCSKPFIFTGGEQEFYASKGLQNEPVRCPPCRTARKNNRLSEPEEGYVRYGVFASFGGRTPRQMHPATCAECGIMTEVPFQPRGDRPVYCSSCYNKIRGAEEAAQSGEAASKPAEKASKSAEATPEPAEAAAAEATSESDDTTPEPAEAPAAEATSEFDDTTPEPAEAPAAEATVSEPAEVAAAEATAQSDDTTPEPAEAAAVEATSEPAEKEPQAADAASQV